jgi:hypothetical protein
VPPKVILLNVVIVGLVVSPGSNQAVNQTLPATLVFMHSASLHFCIKTSSTVNTGYLNVSFTRVPRLKIKYLCVLLVLVPLFVFASGTPKEVVEKYCEYDFNGARLSSSATSKYQNLISYEEEPGWDTVIAVSEYEVGTEEVNGNTAVVIVTYEIIKAWPSPLENIAEYQTAKVKLILMDGHWKVSKYINYPRVGSELLCNNLRFCAK